MEFTAEHQEIGDYHPIWGAGVEPHMPVYDAAKMLIGIEDSELSCVGYESQQNTILSEATKLIQNTNKLNNRRKRSSRRNNLNKSRRTSSSQSSQKKS